MKINSVHFNIKSSTALHRLGRRLSLSCHVKYFAKMERYNFGRFYTLDIYVSTCVLKLAWIFFWKFGSVLVLLRRLWLIIVYISKCICCLLWFCMGSLSWFRSTVFVDWLRSLRTDWSSPRMSARFRTGTCPGFWVVWGDTGCSIAAM